MNDISIKKQQKKKLKNTYKKEFVPHDSHVYVFKYNEGKHRRQICCIFK